MTQVLLTDGEWRIVNGPGRFRSRAFIEHRCRADSSYKGVWVPMRFQYYQFSSPCGWCKARVPEGLQGAWALFTDSDLHTTESSISLHP